MILKQSKVLYITYDGLTDPLGQSQVLPYLKGLVQKGINITILSCEKPDNYQKNKAVIDKEIEGFPTKGTGQVGIFWVPVLYHKKPPVFSTLFDIYRLNQKAQQLHKKTPFDIVHCRSYIAALVGLNLKKRFGVKMIFDMRGFFADERVDGNIWKLSNPVYRSIYNFFKRKEKEFLTKADHTISLTEAGKEIIQSWNLPGQSPITVIPCCVDLDLFDPKRITETERQEAKKKVGIGSGDFVLMYVGGIGTWYMLEEMLEFFKELNDLSRTSVGVLKPSAKFVFLTKEDPKLILNAANRTGIESSKIIIRPASRQEVPRFLSLADYAIYFIKPVFSKKASSPTKQGEILAMNIPIITNSGVGDTWFLDRGPRTAVLIDNFDKESYSAAISQMSEITGKGREVAEEIYALEKGVEKYFRIYQDLIADTQSIV